MNYETGASVDAVQLGRAIAATRAERGLKRGHLAETSGVSYPYLSELENGTKRGSTRKLAQIADALGLTSSQLLARAEALARAETGTPVTGSPATGPTGSPSVPGGGGDDTRSPVRALRPLGRLSERTQELIVEQVTRAVRDEIERWLDAELPEAVREHVRAALSEERPASEA